MHKAVVTGILFFTVVPACAFARYRFSDFRGVPPTHIKTASLNAPEGLSPDVVKKIYKLPVDGGSGTIAIIGAYDNKKAEKDLNVFSKQFGLPACTKNNRCFEKHTLGRHGANDDGWTLETDMDIEWAHAIAPEAKILLVEAATPSGQNLLKAIDYARKRKDVVAVSMSWGGPEFPEAPALESHFASKRSVAFFAASGDDGTGVNWPAASALVVGVGGTGLQFDVRGNFKKEVAWSGSGGGVSDYIEQPQAQADYKITGAHGMRSVPDVAYNADQESGFAVYASKGPQGSHGWFTLGGTSAGAPQWAAIYALGRTATLDNLYAAKANETKYDKVFRDITSGANGDCGYRCTARRHYNFITGLGTPQGVDF